MSGLGWALALGSGAVAAAAAAAAVHGRCRRIGGRPAGALNRHVPLASGRRRPPVGSLVLVGLALTALGLGVVMAVLVALAAAGSWIAVRRRAQAYRRRERDAAVPDLVDLFVLAASAGLPVATGLPVVAERAPAAVREPLVGAVGRMERGGSAAAALDQLRSTLGPRAGPLLDALDSAGRLGTPLAPALDAVSVAAHHQRSQAAEEAARRLPVTLLFPLAACILPAAVLLALVPVLVASLSSLAG